MLKQKSSHSHKTKESHGGAQSFGFVNFGHQFLVLGNPKTSSGYLNFWWPACTKQAQKLEEIIWKFWYFWLTDLINLYSNFITNNIRPTSQIVQWMYVCFTSIINSYSLINNVVLNVCGPWAMHNSQWVSAAERFSTKSNLILHNSHLPRFSILAVIFLE